MYAGEHVDAIERFKRAIRLRPLDRSLSTIVRVSASRSSLPADATRQLRGQAGRCSSYPIWPLPGNGQVAEFVGFIVPSGPGQSLRQAGAPDFAVQWCVAMWPALLNGPSAMGRTVRTVAISASSRTQISHRSPRVCRVAQSGSSVEALQGSRDYWGSVRSKGRKTLGTQPDRVLGTTVKGISPSAASTPVSVITRQ